MVAQHGGHRPPRNPAPASGPGKLSKRTDGGPTQKIMTGTDAAYGDKTALVNQEKGAGMSQSPSIPSMNVPSGPPAGGGSAPAGQPYGGGAFNGPSTQPDVPITNGADIGPGAGAAALGPMTGPGMGPATGAMTQLLSQFSNTDATGVVASLLARAQSLGV